MLRLVIPKKTRMGFLNTDALRKILMKILTAAVHCSPDSAQLSWPGEQVDATYGTCPKASIIFATLEGGGQDNTLFRLTSRSSRCRAIQTKAHCCGKGPNGSEKYWACKVTWNKQLTSR